MNKHRRCVKVGADVIYLCRHYPNKTGPVPLPRPSPSSLSCPPLRYAHTPPTHKRPRSSMSWSDVFFHDYDAGLTTQRFMIRLSPIVT
jgi:hypothetical protein